MGALASYAGPIFSNYVGFGMTVFGGAISGVTEFDIFALDYYDEAGAEDKEPPVSNYYLMGLISMVMINLIA